VPETLPPVWAKEKALKVNRNRKIKKALVMILTSKLVTVVLTAVIGSVSEPDRKAGSRCHGL
jgi:hypothetical protein